MRPSKTAGSFGGFFSSSTTTPRASSRPPCTTCHSAAWVSSISRQVSSGGEPSTRSAWWNASGCVVISRCDSITK
jgi:hypothetical protein